MSENKNRILTLMVLCAAVSTIGIVYGQDYSGQSTSVKFYSDGGASVDMIIEPDPTLARLNVTLIGDIHENILASDSDGIILSWKTVEDGIEVDGLGVDQIAISYTTPSLTNKTGSKWTAAIFSEVNAIVTLPKDAVLVGLDPSPLGITIVEDQAVVTMPAGTSTLSYLLGTTGTKENALVLLTQSEAKIDEIKQMAIIVTSAETILANAQAAYADSQYSLSEQLSKQAKELALATVDLADQATEIINMAIAMIDTKAGVDLTDAQTHLEYAETAFETGLYQNAIDDAQAAYDLAEEAQISDRGGNNLIYIIGGVVVLAAAGGFLMMNRGNNDEKAQKPDSTQPEVDLDAVFNSRPHLRTDDKAILRYIQESGGAFITEIRERFDIPKSSAWRMIKRLEEEGLIGSTTVGRETYLQLTEPEEEQ